MPHVNVLPKTIEVKVNNLDHITIGVKIVVTRSLRIRLCLAIWLVGLAAKLIGAGLDAEVETSNGSQS